MVIIIITGLLGSLSLFVIITGSITGLSMSNSLLLIISCYGKVGYYPFFSVLSMLFYNTSYLFILFDLINKWAYFSSFTLILNVSITDGQLYSNKKLFLDSYRPAIDSALSVSRIGSNAQCRLIKVISVGLKNELTNYRIIELSSSSFDFFKLLSLNQIFVQDHLYISSINLICILITLYRNGILIRSTKKLTTVY